MRGRALLLGALVWALIVSMAPYGAAENAPPEVRINTPDHGSTVSGTVVISGNAWDHDGTVLGAKVHIDAGEWWMATDTSGNGTWWSWETSWDTTTVPNGWHGIGAITWDNASAHGDARIEVHVNNGGGENPPRGGGDRAPPRCLRRPRLVRAGRPRVPRRQRRGPERRAVGRDRRPEGRAGRLGGRPRTRRG